MSKQKYIDQRGVTQTDIVISIIIIILFVSVITTSFYNYYKSIQSKNRVTIATNIAIDVIENVEMMDYDQINNESINTLIEKLKSEGTIMKPYTVTANIQNYNETEGNTNKKNLIKILNVKVIFSDNKTEDFEITRLITK